MLGRHIKRPKARHARHEIWRGELMRDMLKAMEKFKYEARKEFGNDVLVRFTLEGCIVNNIMVFLDNGQN